MSNENQVKLAQHNYTFQGVLKIVRTEVYNLLKWRDHSDYDGMCIAFTQKVAGLIGAEITKLQEAAGILKSGTVPDSCWQEQAATARSIIVDILNVAGKSNQDKVEDIDAKINEMNQYLTRRHRQTLPDRVAEFERNTGIKAPVSSSGKPYDCSNVPQLINAPEGVIVAVYSHPHHPLHIPGSKRLNHYLPVQTSQVTVEANTNTGIVRVFSALHADFSLEVGNEVVRSGGIAKGGLEIGVKEGAVVTDGEKRVELAIVQRDPTYARYNASIGEIADYPTLTDQKVLSINEWNGMRGAPQSIVQQPGRISTVAYVEYLATKM